MNLKCKFSNSRNILLTFQSHTLLIKALVSVPQSEPAQTEQISYLADSITIQFHDMESDASSKTLSAHLRVIVEQARQTLADNKIKRTLRELCSLATHTLNRQAKQQFPHIRGKQKHVNSFSPAIIDISQQWTPVFVGRKGSVIETASKCCWDAKSTGRRHSQQYMSVCTYS